MKAQPAILAFLLYVLLGAPSWAQIPAGGEGLGGIYAGSYLGEDGEHGVVLDIRVEAIEGRAELQVDGTLGIVPVLAGADGAFAEVAGSFTISGFILTQPNEVNAAGHTQLEYQAWLVEPEGYGSANFRGQLTRRDDGLWQIIGTPLAGPNSDFCSDMIATRFMP